MDARAETNPYEAPATRALPPAGHMLQSCSVLLPTALGLMCMPVGFLAGYAYAIEPGASAAAHLKWGVLGALLLGVPSVVTGLLLGLSVDLADAPARRRDEDLARSKEVEFGEEPEVRSS